ncbi:MAG: cobyrinate a,c-diamide synthase, partial [Thermodesulfovibrio sp.]
MYPRILIAGIRGGAGKTTVALSVISLLVNKGLNVIAFKKGPDYIDSGWLSLFSKNPCYNLDTFMIPPERVIKSFIERAKGDISVIEGNRGLYDGLDTEGTVSSAELAKLLKCPVILVVDCTKITRSVAA